MTVRTGPPNEPKGNKMGSLLSVGNVGLFSKNTGNGSGDFSNNTSVSRSGNGGSHRGRKSEREQEHRGGNSGKGRRRHHCDDN
jgi:hypothetical protein